MSNISARSQRLTEIVNEINEIFRQGRLHIGKLLLEVKQDKLYKEDFATFEQFVWDTWGKKKTWAYSLINGYETRKHLSENVRNCGQNELPVRESQTRELAKAPPEKQAEVWESARQGREPEKVTAKELAEARQAAGIPGPQTIKATAEEAQELYQVRLMLEWAENFSGDARQIISSLREYIYNNYNSLSAQPNGHPLWRPLIQEFLDRFEERFSSRPSLTKSDFAQLKSLFKRFPDKNIDWWQRGIDRFTHDTEEWVRDHGQPMRCFADHFNRWNPDKKTADELYREEIERASQSIH